MKKQITLSLLITSTACIHAMEKELSFSKFFSWLLPNQTSNKSQLISDIRKRKNDFERQLLTNEEQVKKALKKQSVGYFMKINDYPIWFLQYCYYQETVQHLDEHLTFIATIEHCKNMNINGYTALGATIISKEPSITKKRAFIQKLLKSGFKLMPKDIELAKLIFYDAIIRYQNTLIDLSDAHPQANWSVLPKEIRTQIVQHMIQLFKNKFWLLPETAANNL